MSSWFSVLDVSDFSRRDQDPGWSTCQIEVECTAENLKPLDDLDVPPFIAVSFDCEMVSLDGFFVNTTKGDFTSCLCATVWRVDRSESQLHVFVLDDRISDKAAAKTALKELNLKGVLHWCATSAHLIESFRDFLVQVDADIITGWNI
jgi:DNA polymerase elongation subunit (family B)